MSAIRALRQVAAPLITRRTLCTATAVPRVAGMRVASLASSQASKVLGMRGFASSAKRFGQGSTDDHLSQKLQEELNYEKETGGVLNETPQFLKDFEAENIWKIEDAPGCDEVTLTRTFGNEDIRLIFGVGEMQVTEEEYNEEDGEENEAGNGGYPIRASVTITKSNGPGALCLDMVVQDGGFLLENICYYDDAKLGTELTAEADWKRRGLYLGPQCDTLDVALQDEFDHFLKERGISGALAEFIPQFSTYKEQKEYVKWLGRVKSFVDL